ncbi:MAG: hypothetical protein AAF519_07230 [Bacteroidota bacterium]
MGTSTTRRSIGFGDRSGVAMADGIGEVDPFIASKAKKKAEYGAIM